VRLRSWRNRPEPDRAQDGEANTYNARIERAANAMADEDLKR
jgi:hypothetical protein